MKFNLDSLEDFSNSSEPLISSSEFQSEPFDKIESPLFIEPSSIDSFYLLNTKKKLFIVEKNKTPFITYKSKKSKPTQILEHRLISKGRWTKEERIKFAFALFKFGTDWNIIKAHVKTRNIIQLRSHGQKFLEKLKTNEYIIKKGLDMNNYNWKQSIDCLKENLNEDEFWKVLYSIESEMGDNNRMTKNYLERKRFRVKMNLYQNEETLNTCHNTFEENNINSFGSQLREDADNNINENNNFSGIINLEEGNNNKGDLYKYNISKGEKIINNKFEKELFEIDENSFNLEEYNSLYKNRSDTLKAICKL